MSIEDHAKNYAQIFQDEREREIAYSGFLQGETFLIDKACEWLKNTFKGGGYVQDYELEEFIKVMKRE